MVAGALVATLALEVIDFITPLNEATRATQDADVQMSQSIQHVELGWKSIAAVAAATAVGVVAANVAMSAASAAAGAAMSAGGFAAEHAKEIALSAAAGGALLRYGSTVNSVARLVVPGYRELGLAVAVGFAAYKVATNEGVQDSVKSTFALLKVSESASKISESFSGLGSSIGSIFTDMGSGALDFANSFNPIPTLFEAAGQVIDGWATTASQAVNSARDTVDYYKASAVAAALAITSSSGMTATAYFNEGEALKEMAKESARVIAVQEGQRGAYQAMREIQEQAGIAAARSEELTSISTLKTVEAINEKTLALQQLYQQLVSTGQLDEGQAKHIANMHSALAGQKVGVEAGRIKEETGGDTSGGSFGTPESVQAMIAQADQQLLKLEQGNIAAAVAALRAANGNDEEAESLRRKLENIEAVTAARQAQTEADRAAEQAQKEIERANKQGSSTIEDLTNQISELTGQTTKYDTLAKNLAKQGISQEQIDEIVRLTKEKDDLLAGQGKDSPATSKEDKNTFAAIGSQDAAKVVLSGLGGGTTKLEELNQKQLKVQTETLVAIKKKPSTKNDDGEDIPA